MLAAHLVFLRKVKTQTNLDVHVFANNFISISYLKLQVDLSVFKVYDRRR